MRYCIFFIGSRHLLHVFPIDPVHLIGDDAIPCDLMSPFVFLLEYSLQLTVNISSIVST